MTEISPTDYFNHLKLKAQDLENEIDEHEMEVLQGLISKYLLTNQIAGAKKLEYLMDIKIQENLLVEKGFTQYVWIDDIKEFITKVDNSVVKIIELENYPREIPDDVVQKFLQVENIFDEFYVVFTDYTGEAERQVEQSKRDKDPILFGTFKKNGFTHEKMYFIGDWEDEYCDITLEKMVAELCKEESREIVYEVLPLVDIEEELSQWEYVRGQFIRIEEKKPKSLWSKLKSFFGGKK